MLNGGFQAGRIYRVSYRAKTLPISGLGLAAFRDTASWVKYSPDALLLVLASDEYRAEDYIRDYGDFLRLRAESGQGAAGPSTEPGSSS